MLRIEIFQQKSGYFATLIIVWGNPKTNFHINIWVAKTFQNKFLTNSSQQVTQKAPINVFQFLKKVFFYNFIV